jgi:hypothetical protein
MIPLDMPRMRAVVAFAAILFPALAFAGPAPICLVAPVAGSSLRGGQTAVVAWDADALPAEAEEWEAFLSIDGGRHYAVRITPHLDIDIRRATWTVPNITAGDARILLRFGDERHESEIEVPLSFAIEGNFSTAALWPAATSSAKRGEEARAGDGGVTAWMAGDRDGGRSHLVTASVPGTLSDAFVRRRVADGDHDATLRRAPFAAQSQSSLILRVASPRLEHDAPPLAAPDILLFSNRLNI